MTSQTESFAALNPHPDVVAALVAKVVSSPWPQGPEQSGPYLAFLGCAAGADLPGREDDYPGEQRGWLHLPGSETGMWSSGKGTLNGLHFFFYPGRQGSRALSEVGFEALYARLNAAYGFPADEVGYPNGHRSGLWHAGQTSIELYAHVDKAPMLQLGLAQR